MPKQERFLKQMLDPIVSSHSETGAQRLLTGDLLRECYLIPIVQPVDLGVLISEPDSPWAESYKNAPRETVSAVTGALRNLMLATRQIQPTEIDISKLDADSRLHHHVEALLDLWVTMGDALPLDIQVMRHVIRSDGSDALEALPIVNIPKSLFSSQAETELRAALVRHHGMVDADAQRFWEERQGSLYQKAREATSLGHAQRGLLCKVDTPIPLDDTLSFWGVRDVAEEAELAAAISQRLIDHGSDPADIAILLPEDPGYRQHLGSAFLGAGIPLSGLPISAPQRDIATETLLLFALALNVPAPAMVLASLYVSPLMPWPSETGAALAREVMKGRFEPGLTKFFEGKAKRLFRALRDDRERNAANVSAQFDLLAQCLTDEDEYRDNVKSLRAQLPNLKSLLATTDQTNWERLLEELNPAAPVSSPPERFVQGISVFSEVSLPWRPAKHLLVLGAVDGRYPRASSASSLFLDSELENLERQTGIRLPGRADHLAVGLELFRRQFSLASENCTFLCPMRDLGGNRQSTSTALSLIARTVRDMNKSEGKAIEEPDALIRDLRSTPQEEWPCSARIMPSIERVLTEQIPKNGQVKLGRDLFMCRLDSEGNPRRQSPSRLEKLMVSPLAWTLAEFGAEEVVWAPETYDHILSGTLAHEVLEYLFPKDHLLPDDLEIDAKVARLLDQAVRKYAPFLNSLLWKVERQGLERDIIRAAKKWSAALATIGAKVIDNEIDIMGEALGLNLFGRADCLLSLPDGRLLIIDHKKSSSSKRRDRMVVGWDLQLGLYRAMLLKPDLKEGVLDDMLKSKPEIGVAYHLINDSGILVNGMKLEGEGFEIIDTEISTQAIEKLQERITEVSSGVVSLNSADDVTFFEKTAKTVPYALQESTLIAAFLIPPENEEDAADE
jgi:hypothetical protein